MDFPLFETLCIENGQVQNLALHQQRYAQSVSEFYANQPYTIFSLEKILQKNTALWKNLHSPIVRCRIDYNAEQYRLQCFPYQRKGYRHFQPVICDEIDYHLKYSDRTIFNELLKQKGNCDEIIIVKQGKITDCTIGNLILRQGGQWFTPDSPLLIGTQRTKLLQQNKIKERSIFLTDLAKYEEIRLINALNPFDDL
ncbi:MULTISPECIES: aminotransferase class IV family protein [unclassified Avibacterium]|uniref:aminotransferase class IV family protein n=1 Tax=unclassified Avibacterium TaxID=2685287 RepID=UPI00218BFF01|nr:MULTISPECIES: aminotransferase class IV family protein [unclassified Avibacterium]MCW9698678.1 aminotransferase class IV family protein [Avibacterium sp. 20-129]MCW9717666.1 aminotransferase class IV family protein [Avibacterium sp. 21-599]URL02427.1 aminotransferase class IV family protein [Avibacterium sp. 20-126]